MTTPTTLPIEDRLDYIEKQMESLEYFVGRALVRITENAETVGRLGQALARLEMLELNSQQQPSYCPGPDECDYHNYLAYGDPGQPNLSHEAYHAAYEKCLEAQDRQGYHYKHCARCQAGKMCGIGGALVAECIRWERKVRA